MTVTEYLLAGSDEIKSIWPEVARHCDKLICAGDHDGTCSWATKCGVGNQTMRFNVFPVAGVFGFKLVEFEAVYVVARSKQHLRVDDDLATSVIRDFLTGLQTKGITVFECKDPGKWAPFC